MKYLVLIFIMLATLPAKASEFVVNNLKLIGNQDAGQTKTFFVEIINKENHDIKVEFIVRELILIEDSSAIDIDKVVAGKMKNPRSIVSNVSIPEKVIAIKAKSIYKAPVIVSLPAGFTGTGLFSFTVQENSDFEKNLGGKMGIVFQKRWTGYGAITETKSRQLVMDFKSLVNDDGLIELTVENVGQSLGILEGFLVAVDKNGKQVSKTVLRSRKNIPYITVFPGTRNIMIAPVTWPNPEAYKYLVSVRNAPEKFIFSKAMSLTKPVQKPVEKPAAKVKKK